MLFFYKEKATLIILHFTNKEYLISLKTNNKYMKTYLLDILNKYNRFSENLDVKTILCNKSWLVFNDTGNKELYIFQENGNLIASVNGNVINGTWQYISVNKSIIISFKEQSYMLHPSFFDKTIFALQQDGTSKYAFMIDEKQSQLFQPKSLTELKSYFENIERKELDYPYGEINKYKETVKQNVLNGDFDNNIDFGKNKSNESNANKDTVKEYCQNKHIVEETFESLNHLVNQLKQNNEEKRQKEEEWEEYKRQRDQKDFDRIEQHRIEREEEEKILKEQENIKKEKEKKEQELREKELRERKERKKLLKEEAFNIECSLNNRKALELAKQISLDIEYAQQQLKKDILEFKVSWLCPNLTYKEITLIINDGKNTLLYEHLSIMGSQTVKLTKAMPQIRITLRLIWFDIPVYKIILIDKNENI